MKKRSLWVLPLAAALALTGCGGSNDSTTGTEASTSSQSSEQASTDQGRTQVPAVNAEQAKAVATALVDGEEGAVILDHDTITASADGASDPYAAMDIEPAQCKEYLAAQSQTGTEGVSVALSMVLDNATGESLVYIIQGIDDESKLQTARDTIESKDLKGCDSFSIGAQGMTMDADVTFVDASSDADATVGVKTEVSVNGEASLSSYQIQGLVGSNAIVVQQTTAETDSDAVLADLTEDLNAAVAELKAAVQ